MLTLAVIRTELVKSLRRTRTYVAYGILVLIPIIMAVAINLNPPDAQGEGRLLFLASQTGLLLPGFALRITSAFMLVIVVALFGGDAIAGEASWGNLRYLLMRPVTRGPAGGLEVRGRGVLRVGRGRDRGGDRVGRGFDRVRHRCDRVPAHALHQRSVDRRHPLPPARLDRVRRRGASPAWSRSRSWCRA